MLVVFHTGTTALAGLEGLVDFVSRVVCARVRGSGGFGTALSCFCGRPCTPWSIKGRCGRFDVLFCRWLPARL